MKNLTLLPLALLAVAWAAPAAPLDKSHVPANPAWVVHLDMDQVRPTAVGQYLLAEMQKPEAQSRFAVFQSLFNFDPRQQLHALTAYGLSAAHDDGVLMVYADFDRSRLETLVKTARDYQTQPHGTHTIHHWIDDKRPAKDGVPPRTSAAIYANSAVIFAQKPALVAQALDVLDRRSPSLVSVDLWPFQTSGGAFIQGFARRMDLGDHPNSAVFRLSKHAAFSLADLQGTIQGGLDLAAETPEVATNIAGIAQGLIALTRLQQAKPDAARIAQALSVTQDGGTVAIRLALPAQDLVAMMKAEAERRAASTAQP